MNGRPGSTGIVHVVVGPARHGVVRHATTLLATPALATHGVYRADGPRGLTDLPTRWTARTGRRPGLLHLHVTDHLLAPDAAGCAELVLALRRQCPVSLTLHDLPQAADGPGRYQRRAAAYRVMADAAVGVIVASAHEGRLLRACSATPGAVPSPDLGPTRIAGPVEVVPLPVEAGHAGLRADRRSGSRRPGSRRRGHLGHPDVDLVVFGYLYPGKGHREVIDAASSLARAAARAGNGPDGAPGALALGEASPGHDALVQECRTHAERVGVRFAVSGHVPDGEVETLLRTAAVPVAPRRAVSASGTIGSWLRAAARPLTPAGPYTDELEARCPGALLRYGPGTDLPTLADAARTALDEPDLTWLRGDEHLGPTPGECGTCYDRHLRRWAAHAREVVT